MGPVAAVDSLTIDVAERLGRTEQPPLTVVCGPTGTELRAAVEDIARQLAERSRRDGHRVVSLKFSDADLTNRLPSLRTSPGTVLFAKDVTRLTEDGLAQLEALFRQFTSTGARGVCAIGLPLPPETGRAFLACFERLRRDGLVRLVTLRPVPRRRLREVVTSLIGALPEPVLCDRLHALTRGWPHVMDTALRIGRDTGLVTIVDRHAYLTAWRQQFRVPANDELLADIRGLGPTAWDAAKAVAVFSPLGPAAPGLVGEALGLTEPHAAEALAELARAGVLVRAGTSWRFRVPVVGLSLESACGPYERRRLAQIAVTALWEGTARCDLDTYLPHQLVEAGRLVDPVRAGKELLASAEQVAVCAPDRSLTWLRAAAELTSDRAERARILLLHARASLLCGEAGPAVSSTAEVLSTYVDEIADDELVDVCFLHLTALHESGDAETLDRIAHDEWWPWPGTPSQRAVSRAFVLTTIGRWRQARALLDEIRRDPDAAALQRHVDRISPMISLWLGDATEFDRAVRDLVTRIEAGRTPTRRELSTRIGALVTLGERRRADELIALSDRVHIRLTTACRAVLAVADGRASEALRLTRESVATGPRSGCDADQTTMFHLAATVQQYRGKLSRAVELIATARERGPVLPHLLAVATSRGERLLGRDPEARRTLETALREADEAGIVAATDLLWLSLADLAVVHGEQQLLPDYLARVETVARSTGTEQAEVHRLILHAVVHQDRAAAKQAAAMLRERGQPLELSSGLERLVRFGVGAPELLLEAYAAAGELDALMCRSWQRNLMRAHGLSVPGRQTTLVENEHLLAVLVADGLGNKQIAALFGASEKSVEGRLTRLFTRTGYRSRVELASAMLTGRFPG